MSSSEVDNAVIAAGLAEKLQFAHNTWKSGREIESEIEEKREKTEEIEGRRGIERVEGEKRDKDREGYREREKENEGEREGGIEKGRERGEMFEMELEYSPRSNVENRDIHKNNKSNNLIRSNNNNTTVNRNRRSKSVQSANIRFPSTAANIERGGLETEEEIQSRKSHETIESNNSDILNDSEAVTLPSYTSTSSTSSTSTSTSSMSQTMQNIKMLTLLASSNKISPTTFSAMMKIAHLPILGTLINSYLITIQHSDGITTKNLFPSISSSKDEPITLIDRLLLSKQLQTTPFFLLGSYFHSFSSIFSSIFSFFIILFLIYFHAIAIVHHGISTLQTTSTSSASSTLSTISTGITPIITSGIASPLSTISTFSSISSTAVPLVISPIFTLFMSNYQRAIFPYLDKMSLPTFKFLPTSISTIILTYIQYIASFAYICLDYISKNYLPESYMPLIKIPISTTSDDILSETNSSLSFTMILDQNSATYWFGISLLCYIIQYVGIITIIASAAYVYSKLDQRFDLSRDISTCIQQVNLIVRTRYYSARGYTCADIFEYYANKYQDRPFLVHNGITWSYRDANFLANRIARWYHSMNIHKNDVVAIAMENCPEYIILWLAAHKVGACAALINYNLTGEPLLHSIRVAAPRVVICDSKMIKNILECRVEAEEEIQRIPIFIYDTLDIAADDAFAENTDDNDSLSLSVVGSVDQDNKGATIIRPGSSSNNGIKHNQPSINAINGKKDSPTNNGNGSMISNRRISSDELITTNNIKNSTKSTNNSSPKMSHINENLTFSTVTSPISSPTSLETYLKEKNVFSLANIFANDDSDTFNGQPTPKEWRKDTIFDDIGLLIYTSGTTGLPKAARLPHSRIYGGGYLFGFRFGVRDNDRIYNVLPLYHSSGGVLTTFLVVTCGGAMIIRNKFSARNFWSDCAKYDATVAMYIGELCRYLLQTPPSVYDKNHKVRLCIGNGLRPEIWGEFQERFNVPHIGEFYASTEGNAALFNFCRDIESRGAIGHMGSFVEYMSNMRLIKLDSEGVPILDKDGHCIQVGENEAGELISKIITWDPIRNFSGYHKNKKGTENKILKNVFTKGDSYFRTGDLLRKDRNNLWHFVDRIGDTFRWKGENVSTAEVAQVVSKYDIYMKNINNSHETTIEECNIYGVQIPNHDGRACCAALTLVPGKKLNFETFAQYVTTSLPGYAVPAFVRILKDGMETTSTFKHKKNELRDEGIDLSLIRNDEMYVLLNKKYHKLTPNIIDDITALKAKL